MDLQHDVFKSDVFSLAMTFIHAMTLGEVDQLNDHIKGQELINKTICMLEKQGYYDQWLIELVALMSNHNEEHRPNFSQVAKKLRFVETTEMQRPVLKQQHSTEMQLESFWQNDDNASEATGIDEHCSFAFKKQKSVDQTGSISYDQYENSKIQLEQQEINIFKNSTVYFEKAVDVKSPINSMCLIDDEFVILGLENGQIVMLSANSLNIYAQWQAHEEKITAICYLPQKKFLLKKEQNLQFFTGSFDCSIKLWNIKNKDSITKEFCYSQVHNKTVTSLLFVPELNYLISGSSDKNIKVFAINPSQPQKNKFVETLLGHSGNILSLSTLKFQDKILLLSGDTENTIMIWNLNNCTLIKSFIQHNGSVFHLLPLQSVLLTETFYQFFENKGLQELNQEFANFSVHGLNYIISIGGDKQIKIFNIDNGELLSKSQEEYRTWICGAGFCKKLENVLITCEGTGKLHFWNYLTNEQKKLKLFGKNPRALVNEIEEKINGMQVTKDGEIFVTTTGAQICKFIIA